ncbi:hypothetical protein [Pedobacter ureilyticus]|jgi:hypothetical protein|uniref:hypothetical protein n=1 Tax=Pedobacter ureilyticus TaxID=1393051 RepID=UPI0014786DFB
MEAKRLRVVLFPEDLRSFSGGGTKTNYRLYNEIRAKFQLEKKVRITIYHVRDYFHIPLEDVIHGIF